MEKKRQYSVGEIVRLDGTDTLWRVDRYERCKYWVKPENDSARIFANLSSDGTIGFTRNDLVRVPVANTEETLL